MIIVCRNTHLYWFRRRKGLASLPRHRCYAQPDRLILRGRHAYQTANGFTTSPLHFQLPNLLQIRRYWQHKYLFLPRLRPN